MKKLFPLLVTLLVSFCSRQTHAQAVDGIDAVVHDSVVTHYEVEMLTGPAFEALARQYRSQPDILEKKVSEAERENLDTLVGRRLILQEFKTFKVPESILDAEVDREIQSEIKARYGDQITLMKTLQAQGITFEKHKQSIREHMIVSWLRQKNVSSEVIISPHKVETYYLAHREEESYKMEDQVNLRMIVLNKTADVPEPKKLAEELLAKLNEGTSFAELAGMYSQGSSRKDNGLWGWADKKTLRKELADVAFTLKAGEHSGVIEVKNPESSESYYLMLVEERQTAHYRTLGEMRSEIEQNLKLEELSRLEKQWIAKLKKKTYVQYFR
jgi:peptidyl-prolyl cis-trans isomerase SurA